MIAFFYDLFYMIPLGIAFILSIFGLGAGNSFFVAADGSVMPVLPGCMASCFIIVLLLVIRHSGKKERILITGVVIVAAVSFLLILGKEEREIIYGKYSWMIAVSVISVIAIIVGKAAEKMTKVKIAVSVLLLAGTIVIMVSKAQCPKGTFGFCILVIMIYLMETVQRYWQKSGYTDIKNHVTRVAPILLIVIFAAIAIPAPKQKFEWKIAKNIWKATVTEYKRLIGTITADKEEYSYTGFSEEGNIGAGVSDNAREVMLISSEKRSSDRLYMGGIAFEEFDGSKWVTHLEKEAENEEFDYIETKAAISNFKHGSASDFLKGDVVTVSNRLFSTKFVFAPPKSNMQSYKTTLPKHMETQSRIVAADRMKYGDTYNIDCLSLNYNNPDLFILADTAEPFGEDTWNETLLQSRLNDNEHLTYSKYLAYKDNIYKQYGGNREFSMEEALEKSQLSDEVKSIVSKVIADAKPIRSSNFEQSDANVSEADYANKNDADIEYAGMDKDNMYDAEFVGDYEKLKALSDYLQAMDYSRQAQMLPKDIDNAESYLDYFLLESQRGYCIHYATAFTLLARQLGHPARYVQGYYVKQSGSKNVLVTENRAHAWAEVYFDNFGWMTFESTPGYSIAKGWSTKGGVFEGEKKYTPNAAGSVSYSDILSEKEAKQEYENNYTYILYCVIPILCALIFGIIYLPIARVVAEKKYRKMNDEDKVRTMIAKNIRILRILGYSLGELVTIEEYRSGIVENAELKDAVGFLKLYERLLYSDVKVNGEDVEQIERDYGLLKDCLKAKGGRYRFYIV